MAGSEVTAMHTVGHRTMKQEEEEEEDDSLTPLSHRLSAFILTDQHITVLQGPSHIIANPNENIQKTQQQLERIERSLPPTPSVHLVLADLNTVTELQSKTTLLKEGVSLL